MYLPQPSLMVLNDTKVAPSRVMLTRKPRGVVEVLFLINEMMPGEDVVRVLVDRKVLVGDELTLPDGKTFRVVAQEENIFTLRLAFSPEELIPLLHRYGTTPTPPYIKKSTLSEEVIREKYQTVFAKREASVAAPTASLHFTKDVFDSCARSNIERVELTLDVGMGTFAPVREVHHRLGKLHVEPFYIHEKARSHIEDAKKNGTPIVAVGTTVVRTLESFAATGKANGMTDLFIRPPYDFKMVDALVTNFHVPASSLMYLVDAFLRFKKCPLSIKEIYEFAVRNDLRFYSFGDAMLIV
jgi:S-adenosylmethionine:tRNA ribosyltransferase-isomerase